jgi:hypothetical protein
MKRFSRRNAFRAVGGFLICATSFKSRNTFAGALADTQEATQAQWLDDVFLSDKAPKGPLRLHRFSDQIYAVTEPISWIPNVTSSKSLSQVDVPAGFITDFASVPRIFWSVLPRDGKYLYPAIVHDYMYWTQSGERETADETLREGMEEFKVDFVSTNAVYWGVRAAGWLSWAANAKLRKSGEKRVITKYPTDPLISWAEWKKDPTVYD